MPAYLEARLCAIPGETLALDLAFDGLERVYDHDLELFAFAAALLARDLAHPHSVLPHVALDAVATLEPAPERPERGEHLVLGLLNLLKQAEHLAAAVEHMLG